MNSCSVLWGLTEERDHIFGGMVNSGKFHHGGVNFYFQTLEVTRISEDREGMWKKRFYTQMT